MCIVLSPYAALIIKIHHLLSPEWILSWIMAKVILLPLSPLNPHWVAHGETCLIRVRQFLLITLSWKAGKILTQLKNHSEDKPCDELCCWAEDWLLACFFCLLFRSDCAQRCTECKFLRAETVQIAVASKGPAPSSQHLHATLHRKELHEHSSRLTTSSLQGAKQGWFFNFEASATYSSIIGSGVICRLITLLIIPPLSA